MSRFAWERRGLVVDLSPDERRFLGDVVPMLASLAGPEADPAAARLQVPVYLDDPESNDEWWRLMGSELEEARRSDRALFEEVVGEKGPRVLTTDEGDALLRVLNEARLVLGARLGIEVEEDHDRVTPERRAALDILGWFQEELTEALTGAL
jgi:hypothetical protein